MKYGVHWFRRDLRVAGNLALQKQFSLYDGKVVGIFCFDKKFLDRPDFSINRFHIFLKTLKSLQDEMRVIGSDLLFLDVGPFEAFPNLMNELESRGISKPETVSWCRDYEPYARKRDENLVEMMDNFGIDHFTERDHLLIEPHELERDKGEGYKVYTPFSRKWLEIFQKPEIQKRVKLHKKGFTYLNKLKKGQAEKIFKLNWKRIFKNDNPYPDHLNEYIKSNGKLITVPIPEAGSIIAFEKLKEFKKRVDEYKDKRDIPSINGTSKLSIYLKNGSLTIPQIIAYFDLEAYTKKDNGRGTFLSELIWREFYYHILYRHPRVETEEFILKFKDLDWDNDKKLFKAWKEGKTGFPIVDAGMRELKETGWMHNRVRMIVASFLIKDLLIDWRWGEKFFMDTLLDGDIAPNNGGWQWAASTGCDAQPYFRIFNPWLQSKRFDPNGDYIKKFVPELADIEAKKLHAPILDHPIYPKPIVEHKEQRDKALAMYKLKS